jgi:ATP-dependent Lhr-like helicase
MSTPALSFSGPTAAWFATTFGEPTAAQAEGWPPIADGHHTLICAPTGSGKTLAAFLHAIDRVLTTAPPADERARTRVLYVSPMRALAVDVEKNLRAPLAGIRHAAERSGGTVEAVTVGIRSGDTPADERRRLRRYPPHILITTPESLFLMLTSQARTTLANVEQVIVDEIHVLAGNKRGAHLALSLERLERVTVRHPQRIGLSATQRPLEEVARFLGGYEDGRPRPVTIVDAGVAKELDLAVVVPIEDMADLASAGRDPGLGPQAPARSIWPAIHPRLLELILAHRTTLVFANSRRLAERLATVLNELADQELVFAHHGSLSRERRLVIEDRLKRGDIRALVCTSSLELGIDMGSVDLVIQVESPRSVASGMQRIGRAGHQVGEPSRGRIFPKHRADLLEATVVAGRMERGAIEATRVPRNPIDVLAQHLVAACAMDGWKVPDLAALVRGAANFAELTDDVLAAVLDMLAGRYPSESFRELRPRLVWDRVDDTVRGRAGAQRLAVTSGGTIPDRGLFGVFLPDGTRVGELDEEMVYESRPGETFLLGASTWRIQEITFERVIVVPAPGEPGRMPFWHGDGPGRPYEVGRAVGEFVRTLREPSTGAVPPGLALLDPLAVSNLRQYLDDQAAATGAVPDDRTIVVERFPDEIGDWRVCILTPFGSRVHGPWAVALRRRLTETLGTQPEVLWSDDGIVLRLPEALDSVPLEQLLPAPEELDDLLLAELPETALFAARFRECAARALLLPRRRPGQRTPLWQQRQRARDLLTVALDHPDFPILLETTRECLNDVFDVPALRGLLRDIRSRVVRVVTADTAKASPFAQSLLFGWIAVYMYEGDAPVAERRAAALALDRDLLRELLGAEDLRELLDAGVLAELELELQLLTPGRGACDADELHDVLRRLGPLDTAGLVARSATGADVAGWLAELAASRRAIAVTMADRAVWAAAEDAARLRDALGVALPVGLPAAYTEPVEQPLADLVARFARTHGPFPATDLVAWLGISPERVTPVLAEQRRSGVLVEGELRPGGSGREWCDDGVLRILRRRSLAALRREIEPVEGDAYARFLPVWQQVGSSRRGPDAVADVLTQLQGAALVASALERSILASRVPAYGPLDLDSLCASGEVVWIGDGPIGPKDGRIRLYFRDQAALLLPGDEVDAAPAEGIAAALGAHLATAGASFWPELVQAAAAAGLPYDDASVLASLWDLVWAGVVTNDSFAPLRAFVRDGGTVAAPRGARGRPRPGRLTRTIPAAASGRWSLVASLRVPAPGDTARRHAAAMQLLERYGVLTREAVLAEEIPGGFAAVYQVLKAMEEQGRVRRGYFVAGLGAAQFALPGAVDRLRSEREVGPHAAAVTALAATDPAQPYGAALPWPASPGRPARAAGAVVVLRAGAPVCLVESRGRGVVTFGAPDWPAVLVELVTGAHLGSLELTRVDGAPVLESPWVAALADAGFSRGYRGFSLRATRR